MAVLSVTEETFQQEVLESELPVLVDLWAEWCRPCKELGPRVESVAKEFEGRLKVVRVNVDQSPRLAQVFEARSIPMLVVIAGGRPVKSAVGALPRNEIVALVEPFLPRAENEVSARELAQLLRDRRVVPLDVREPAVFARAHIPGARNAPAETLDTVLAALARERKVPVLYDRAGGEAAHQALDGLTARSVRALLLTGGFLAWESEGYDVERPD